MIKLFADRGTQKLYLAGTAKRFPLDMAARAARKLEYVDLAMRLEDLKFVNGDAYDVTVAGLAEAVGVSRQSINELPRARRAVSPGVALRLSRLFRNSPEFWLNAQRAVDLWDAAQAIKDDVARIKPLRVA